MASRIKEMRALLKSGLYALGHPAGSWDHITEQIGMFSFTGLTPAQSERMTQKWHVYMLKTGRISIAGLTRDNIAYVVEAIDDCVKNCVV